MGAWIEICTLKEAILKLKSLPLWERGLKYNDIKDHKHTYYVAPLVGAWIEIVITKTSYFDLTVAPLVGAWIEI